MSSTDHTARRVARQGGAPSPYPGRLVLLRHGESRGNADELFCGLMDVPLTERGHAEALQAARLMTAAGPWPRRWTCSPMLRSRQTLDVLLGASPVEPRVVFDGRLVERNYGALTGHVKSEVRERYGERQFLYWRRSMDGTPPPLDPALLARLAEPFLAWPHVELTATECLRDVVRRVGFWWREAGAPVLDGGEDLLVVAHGNSLRALCAVVLELGDDEVSGLNIPNAQPLVLERDASGGWERRYLDPATAEAAAERIAREGGT